MENSEETVWSCVSFGEASANLMSLIKMSPAPMKRLSASCFLLIMKMPRNSLNSLAYYSMDRENMPIFS
ncbi:hypothetical protein LRU_01203 [Ligilactobacillus ruminis SPM0211]|uniref:Uncharacterized protein n=1 Tax=Ligilactobacillus ruminis SPM0211 TaxID=1040964 RepID=F7R074_9LACO|nr:hypothetical protein LRU_01203 [Ligilactobacillus ruminis SPM0211]